MYGLINYLVKLCFRAKKIEVQKTVTASIEAGRKLERKKKKPVLKFQSPC